MITIIIFIKNIIIINTHTHKKNCMRTVISRSEGCKGTTSSVQSSDGELSKAPDKMLNRIETLKSFYPFI